MTVGVISLGNIQTQARDDEREQDIVAIARGLESYYNNGNANVTGYNTKGSYPDTVEFSEIMDQVDLPSTDPARCALFRACRVNGGYSSRVFTGTVPSSFIPPNLKEQSFTTSYNQPERSPVTVINDYIQTKIDAGWYMYKPMKQGSDAACSDPGVCTRYALIYKRETPNSAGNTTIIVKSKHQ